MKLESAYLDYTRGTSDFSGMPNTNDTNPENIGAPHHEILSRLLDIVEPVDFRALAEMEDGEKLQKKHYLVIVIEEVLRLAEENNWGLCKNTDFIYLFNGVFWHQLEPEEIQDFLGRAAERMGVDRFDALHYDFRDKLYRQFLTLSHLPKPEPAKDSVCINLQNGTLEITPSGARLREHRREDFLTYVLPFEYNPKAPAPRFYQYLNRVLPDPEKQRILAEYLGYVFVRPSYLKLEKVLVLYGSGANGKSVFFEVVEALLGRENVTNYSLQSLTDDKGYSRAKIVGKLVNYASEINASLEAAAFKALASGESIEARLPYGQPFTATDYAKLIFNCNVLPKEVEHTEGFFRRFLIVLFDVTIPESEQDKTLSRKIIDNELSGVLNWVLQGLDRLLTQRDFSDCMATQTTLAKYRLESDSVQMFLADKGYQRSLNEVETLDVLYQEYKAFCMDDGYKAASKKTFRERLENSGFQITRRSSGNVVFVEKGNSVHQGNKTEPAPADPNDPPF